MKVKVEFITARLNGKLLFVEAINSVYDEIGVLVRKSDLDEETIKAIMVVKYENIVGVTIFNLGCGEVKDSIATYGNLVVAIESKEIDFE